MKHFISIVFFLLILSLVFPQVVLASGFQVKTVGALNVEGITYNHLWYTDGNVTFSGVALQNAQITATMDGNNQTATADASGNWSYSTTLTNGDHSISFASDGSTVSFTLTIGEVPADIGNLPAASTPAVGIVTPTFLLLFLGTFLILSPVFLKRLI